MELNPSNSSSLDQLALKGLNHINFKFNYTSLYSRTPKPIDGAMCI